MPHLEPWLILKVKGNAASIYQRARFDGDRISERSNVKCKKIKRLIRLNHFRELVINKGAVVMATQGIKWETSLGYYWSI